MHLIERSEQLAALAAAWEEAAAGRGGVVLVAGEAGVGKSALVDAFAAAVPGARTLRGLCDALHTPRPLGPLLDVLSQLGGGRPEGDREALFRTFLDEIHRTATLVVFEDVHWADDATLDLLKFAGRRIRGAPSLLLLTYRDDEVGPEHPLRGVLAEIPRDAVRRVRPTPLTAAGVEVLARGAGRSERGLFEATGGNPFFVTEVLANPDEAIPASVRDAVYARAAGLPGGAREVLDLVALVPGATERSLLAAVLAPAPAAVEQCLAAGMLITRPGILSFRHELARRAWEDAVEEGRARAIHAAIQAFLESAPADSARLVHHADRAGDAAAVLRHAPAAAAQAARVGAHREAAAHLEVALRCAGTLPAAERLALVEQLAYERYLTGSIDAAVEARLHALALAEEAGDRTRYGDTLRWLSRLSWFQGRQAEARRYAGEAVVALEPLGASGALAMAYSNLGQLAMLAEEAEDAARWAARAAALAESLGDEETLAHALNNLGTARWRSEENGREQLERSLRLSLAGGLHEHAARAYTNLGSHLVSVRRYAEGLGYLDTGIAFCEERDLDSWSLYMLGWRARAHLEQGRWTEAAADSERVLASASARGILRLPALLPLATLRARRGDPGAGPLLEEAWRLAERSGELQRMAPAAAARAEAAWLRGEAVAAEEMEPVLGMARDRGNPWLLGMLAVWSWRTGGLREPPEGCAAPFAHEIAGDWRGAAEAWAELGCPYERALALAGGDDEAAAREAAEVLHGLGATAAAQAVGRLLRGRGIRGLPRGPRDATRRNPAGLTRQQMRVLELVAAGCSNAEIARRLYISPKTAEHHVGTVLSRLGVRSRGEAAARARALGLIAAT